MAKKISLEEVEKTEFTTTRFKEGFSIDEVQEFMEDIEFTVGELYKERDDAAKRYQREVSRLKQEVEQLKDDAEKASAQANAVNDADSGFHGAKEDYYHADASQVSEREESLRLELGSVSGALEQEQRKSFTLAKENALLSEEVHRLSLFRDWVDEKTGGDNSALETVFGNASHGVDGAHTDGVHREHIESLEKEIEGLKELLSMKDAEKASRIINLAHESAQSLLDETRKEARDMLRSSEENVWERLHHLEKEREFLIDQNEKLHRIEEENRERLVEFYQEGIRQVKDYEDSFRDFGQEGLISPDEQTFSDEQDKAFEPEVEAQGTHGVHEIIDDTYDIIDEDHAHSIGKDKDVEELSHVDNDNTRGSNNLLTENEGSFELFDEDRDDYVPDPLSTDAEEGTASIQTFDEPTWDNADDSADTEYSENNDDTRNSDQVTYSSEEIARNLANDGDYDVVVRRDGEDEDLYEDFLPEERESDASVSEDDVPEDSLAHEEKSKGWSFQEDNDEDSPLISGPPSVHYPSYYETQRGASS